MGNQFNYRIGKFLMKYANDKSIEYSSNAETSNNSIARMGHLAFYDSYMDQILIFGGQRSGDKNIKQTNQRLMMNDVILYDHK